MNTKNFFSEEFHSLAYGLAHSVFGDAVIDAVIHDKKWMGKYPNVIKGISSDEVKRYGTILPAEIVYEIAGRDDCIFDFYATPDGERLFARYRHKKWDEPRSIDIEIQTKGYLHIPNQQALLVYGAFCLFRAVDSGYGRKGETGTETSIA